jgi:ABC-type multidrug transport system ATPase subunit
MAHQVQETEPLAKSGNMKQLADVPTVTVSVKNFGLSIPQPRSMSDILRNQPVKHLPILSKISFDIQPGQVIAIMGSSGSGKTSLLNALAGRDAKSQTAGSIQLNGQTLKKFDTSRYLAYVQQMDYLMPYLTVRETLRYAAELRLDASLSKTEKYELVEEVILELGLKECANTLIGDDWRKGISGGERRRVSVGCQLLINPSIIFLDEPTTGTQREPILIYCLLITLYTSYRTGCIHFK